MSIGPTFGTIQILSSSAIVLKPKTNEEVSKILLFCDNNRLAVCPQGGNTSVVGGSVPVFDEVIISMELMNKIISLDETSGEQFNKAGDVTMVIIPLGIIIWKCPFWDKFNPWN
ncbi:hypothetical protein NQ317_005524 [Molorchus minor]|uniref:FAD-binding PCMH-type domain-containing protein n=1 Tax=Molorchus minor TaxID=1323400 RepID=A0ABQ9J228_9CUCU|nr:hypothetical protein NQ317_005524 [Molorchus minor]